MTTDLPILDRSQILAGGHFDEVTVDVAELGGSVRLRVLSYGHACLLSDLDKADRAVAAAVLSIVDEAGDRMFTLDDLPRFRELPHRALAGVMRKALELNGFLDEAAG